VRPPSVEALVSLAAHSFSGCDLLRVERLLLDALEFKLAAPTPYGCLHLLTQVRACPNVLLCYVWCVLGVWCHDIRLPAPAHTGAQLIAPLCAAVSAVHPVFDVRWVCGVWCHALRLPAPAHTGAQGMCRFFLGGGFILRYFSCALGALCSGLRLPAPADSGA
jgi:hypothetical protein